MSLIKWKNSSLFPSVSGAFEDIFGEPFFTNDLAPFNMPAANVEETETNFLIKMAVPGLEKSDIKVEIDRDLLTISAEKEMSDEEENKNYTRKEYSYNSFKRTFTIPENIKSDGILATCEKGELLVTLPKSKLEIKNTKRIEVL